MLSRMPSAALFALVAGSAMMLSDIAQAGCTLYQHRDYGGSRYRLNDGDNMIMANQEARCSLTTPMCSKGGKCKSTQHCDIIEPSWNDQLSSFKVSGGCTLTLWQHINRGGAKLVRDYTLKYVGSAWNDQASQAYCSCR